MAEKSKIEWTESTWNPVVGCTKVSEGCKNCYAERMAGRLAAMGQGQYRAVIKADANEKPIGWSGDICCVEKSLEKPLHWRKPRMIFVCSMGDLFHEDVPFDYIDKVFAVMALCPQHTFQILTKRPQRMLEYLLTENRQAIIDWQKVQIWRKLHGVEDAPWTRDLQKLPATKLPLPNVWLGVTAENQAAADERIPLMLQCPAAVRFVSYEPALGPLDLTPWLFRNDVVDGSPVPRSGLRWIICGGESGPGARPMHPNWARQVRDDCDAAGVPFFFKQWGEWYPVIKGSRWVGISGGGKLHDFGDGLVAARVGKKKAGRMLDGREHNAMPAESE
jgi:protein gp37